MATAHPPLTAGHGFTGPEAASACGRLVPGNARWKARLTQKQRHLEAFEWRDRANTWAASHDKHQVKARIPPSIEAMFDLWFTTVDLDAGGTISTDELVTTLAASGLPAEREAVEEFVRFMDTDCSGEVDLAEFKSFMCEQMSRGHAVNEGTVMLPTGETITFGNVVAAQMRRTLLADMLTGDEARARWTRQQGRHALAAIETQRALLRNTAHHRRRASAKSSAQKRGLARCKTGQAQVSRAQLAQEEGTGDVVPLQTSKTLGEFVMRQRGLREDLLGSDVALRRRKRQFRKVMRAARKAQRERLRSMRAGTLAHEKQQDPVADANINRVEFGELNACVVGRLGATRDASHRVAAHDGVPDLAHKLEAHAARMRRIFRAPGEDLSDACSSSGSSTAGIPAPDACQPGPFLPSRSRRSCLADFEGTVRRLTAVGGGTVGSERDTASSHSSAAPQCLHTAKVAMLIQDLNKKMLVDPYERKLDLTYKYNRPFKIASRGAGGLEWSAMAQRERAQVDRERAKLHRLGGLAATPLLPSLQTAQPRGQNAPTRRAGATGRRGRPQWMQQQSQALGEGAAQSCVEP